MAVAVAALLAAVNAQPAKASGDDVALNGTYRVVSDGQWAKTNDSYHDEATVTSIWTITSTCSDFQDCTGRVVSDLGWTAELTYRSEQWRVRRTVPNWQHCDDGTTTPGEQIFEFWRPAVEQPATKLNGWDDTTGPSGNCGINVPLNITMPLHLTLIS